MISLIPSRLVNEVYKYFDWYDLYIIGLEDKNLSCDDILWKPLYYKYFSKSTPYNYRENFIGRIISEFNYFSMQRSSYSETLMNMDKALLTFFMAKMNEYDLIRFLLFHVKEETYAWVVGYASDRIRCDYEIAEVVVSEANLGLRYLHRKMQNNETIVRLAVQRNGLNLEYASDYLKRSHDLVSIAVRQNGDALVYADKSLLNDFDLVKMALEQKNVWPKLSSKMRNDKRLVKLAITKWGIILKEIPEHLRNDKEIALLAVEIYPVNFLHVGKKLKNDIDIVKAVVSKNGFYLHHIDQSLKDNDEVVLSAIKQSGSALNFASDRLKDNYNLVELALQSYPKALMAASVRLKDDEHLVELAVRQDPETLYFASDRLKDTECIVQLAIQNDPLTLRFASKRLQKTLIYNNRNGNTSAKGNGHTGASISNISSSLIQQSRTDIIPIIFC